MSFKVSHENLSHQFRRTQKILSKEINNIQANASNYENWASDLVKIQNLLQIMETSSNQEKLTLTALEARINESILGENETLSFESKMLVMIGVTLLQRGHFDAVDSMILDCGPWLAHHLDVEVFRNAALVVDHIRVGDLQEVLNWITNHASKLRRLGSKLEFFVRQEQFLSLVYFGNIVEALHFAQEHLAPLVVENDDTTGNEANDKSAQSTPNRTPEAPPLRNRAVSLGASPRTPSNTIDFSSIRPSNFLPFTFPTNPLAFLTPRSESRTPNESPLTRENRSMTIGCDTPPPGPGLPSEQIPSSTSKGSIDYSPLPLTIEDQTNYVKEAMCHLMSMLAFGTQGQIGTKGQGSFNSVVPQIYSQESKELRLRYLVDLFHLEVRRVYRFSNVSPLERLIEYGIFSLKTNSCSPSREKRIPRSVLEEDSAEDQKTDTIRSPNIASGNAIMMTALRILQQGITRSHSHEERSTAAGSFSPPPPVAAPVAVPPATSILPPQSESSSRTLACPVCSLPGQLLVTHLPSPVRSSSRIKCRGSGEVMNHNNPPLVLPNGQVYSKNFMINQANPSESINGRHSHPTPASTSSPASPASGPHTTDPNKGIQLLLTFREHEKQKSMTRNNLQNETLSQPPHISRVVKKMKVGEKEEEEERLKNSKDLPKTSDTLFCCPLTNQTYHLEKDTKQVFII